MKPNLERMTPQQRIEYLNSTTHLVAKHMLRIWSPHSERYYYYSDSSNIAVELNEATVYDMKYFTPKIDGFELVSISLKDFFKMKLQGWHGERM